jgi:hypothetical protein
MSHAVYRIDEGRAVLLTEGMTMNTYLGKGIIRFFQDVIAAGLLSGLLTVHVGAAAPEPKATAAVPTESLSPDEVKARRDWHEAMKQVPPPKKGCFQASYPDKQWKEVQCTTPPPYPGIPRRGPRPGTVGNGNDVSAEAPSGLISSATGTFTVSGVTSETSPINNVGPGVANAYMLQINTNTFSGSAACTGGAAGCVAWEQFFFTNNGTAGAIYMQYWLIGYGTCPTGQSWNQSGSSDCYKNSTNSKSVPNQPITNLGNLEMTGELSTAGDTLYFSTGPTSTDMHVVTGDNIVGAAAHWQIAEFNVFGLFSGAEASFNNGAFVTPKTQIVYGGTNPAICASQGFTGETNNLNFGPSAPTVVPPGPAIAFEESSAGGASSACAAASSIGDTHLQTAAGLLYDFQAAGDFILIKSEPDFVVQTRQVSGAPTWPNADVNHAVAAQMGKSKIAVCLAPARLSVDGKTAELADGASLVTADGVTVSRRGTTYAIVSETGDSVQAEVNPTWINVSVGLGHWPAKISGVLANPNGNVNQLALRDGTVMNVPYAFQDLYPRYADSWRVKQEESLLSACGDREIEQSVAAKPFYAVDLEPKLAEQSRAVCQAAGVKEGALLDACTLDVAVIGDNQAAKVFVGMRTPTAVGSFNGSSGPDLGALLKKWWWLLIVIVVVLALLLLRRK